jgi:hypothetical protein
MQRLIVIGGVIFVLLAMLLGGGLFLYRDYYHRPNKMTRIWLPLPAAHITAEQRRTTAASLTKHLTKPEVMAAICKDAGYAKTAGMASEPEATKDLLGKFFCEVGTAVDPKGGAKVSSINVGFNCKAKDIKKLEGVTSRMGKEVERVLQGEPLDMTEDPADPGKSAF